MLQQLITEDCVRIYSKVHDWQDAIHQAAQPLIDNGAIAPRYVDAIIRSHEKLGPYYVVAPGIAMPHARPEDGVRRLSLALCVVKDGVYFGSAENDPIHLLVTLAASDSNSHVNAIASLAELFMNQQDVETICQADEVSEILSILNNY